MRMTRDQLTVLYLMLNRKTITKRELLKLGYKARTIHSLVEKGLLSFTNESGEVVVSLTNKSYAFDFEMRRLRNEHPNVRNEGEGTYMVRLAKLVAI